MTPTGQQVLRQSLANVIEQKTQLAGLENQISTRQLQVDSIIEVMLGGAKPRPVGRARVVRVERRGTSLQRYGFEFVTPPANWIVK